MKVLLVLGPAEVAGIQRHVAAFVPTLVRRNDVTVVFLFEDGPAARQIREAGATVYVLGGRNGHSVKMGVGFARLLRRVRPEVVHFHETHLVPLVVCRVLGVKAIVATEHCSLANTRALWKTRVLYRLLGGLGARMTAVSSATLDAVADLGGFRGVRDRVVWNCVDIDRLGAAERLTARRNLGLPADAEIVGAVGRLAAQKGWDLFLDVCERAAEARPRLIFVVAGAGPEEDRLRERIAKSKLADGLRFLGFQANGAEVICALDVFILTSLHEELPTTLLESFAVGTPVAGVIPDGGVRELLGLPGAEMACGLREERDAVALAADVIELLGDGGLRERRVKAGRRLVEEHFSGAATARDYVGVYERCCGQNA